MRPVVIGTITVKEQREERQLFECAAWYKDLLLDTGTFNITLTFSPECWPYWILWKQGGTVLGSCFDALWCGTVISAKRDEDKGQRSDFGYQLYAYSLRTLELGEVNLLPEWQWLLKDSAEWGPHVKELREKELVCV